jgi:hypothetical protein
MKKEEQVRLLNEQYSIILDREGKLSATDYVAAKIAEGSATKEEYAEKIELRRRWRAEINAAQTEVERLITAEIDEEVVVQNEGLGNNIALQETKDEG